MDPPTLINQDSFPNNANPNPNPNPNPNVTPYNLSQIWPFPIHPGTSLDQSGTALALTMPHFPHNFPHFGDIPMPNPVTLQLHHRVVAPAHGASKKRRDSEVDLAKVSPTSNGNNDNGNTNSRGTNDCGGKRLKTAACRDDNNESKTEAETRSGKPDQNSQPPPEHPKQDYIHVRARRGQATDSHSLAERARREKISERMKVLQDLVPGCNKVIGKALVLDEIINYIQSLQGQVEFLSMKLEAVNSRVSPGIEVFPPKDFGQQTFDTTGVAFGSQTTREYSRGSSPEWLHMQIGGSFERTT